MPSGPRSTPSVDGDPGDQPATMWIAERPPLKYLATTTPVRRRGRVVGWPTRDAPAVALVIDAGGESAHDPIVRLRSRHGETPVDRLEPGMSVAVDREGDLGTPVVDCVAYADIALTEADLPDVDDQRDRNFHDYLVWHAGQAGTVAMPWASVTPDRHRIGRGAEAAAASHWRIDSPHDLDRLRGLPGWVPFAFASHETRLRRAATRHADSGVGAALADLQVMSVIGRRWAPEALDLGVVEAAWDCLHARSVDFPVPAVAPTTEATTIPEMVARRAVDEVALGLRLLHGVSSEQAPTVSSRVAASSLLCLALVPEAAAVLYGFQARTRFAPPARVSSPAKLQRDAISVAGEAIQRIARAGIPA